MSDAPRRWFQINVVTAVVLLIVAGGFLWVNWIVLNPVPCGGQRGWPFAYLLDSPGGFNPPEAYESVAPEWLAPHVPVVLDVFAALFVLVLVARFAAWIRTPQRRWPQIHLSTALVMMFVAGSLMWLNAHVWKTYAYDSAEGKVEYTTHGWPSDCVYISHFKGKAEWSWMHCNRSSNVFVGLVLMYAAMQLCEWRIRRREARKA
jgi:hypothetical protein